MDGVWLEPTLSYKQDNNPKHSSKHCKNYFEKKQSAGNLSFHGVASTVTESQPYWAVGAAGLDGTHEQPIKLLHLVRCFGKHGVKSLQIISTNWQLECLRSARLHIFESNYFSKKKNHYFWLYQWLYFLSLLVYFLFKLISCTFSSKTRKFLSDAKLLISSVLSFVVY